MEGNITCPLGPSAAPSIAALPVPQNINIILRPGVSTTREAMAACCAPSPVQLVDGCYLWCEIPARYFNNSASHDAVVGQMTSCIRAEDKRRNFTGTGEPIGTAFQFNAAGRVAVVRGVGVWVLLVSGLVWAI